MRSTVHRAGGTSAPGVSTLTPHRPRRVLSGPRIAALSLADSPASLDQGQVLERLGLSGDEFAERVFARSGVQRRRMELEEDFLALNLQGRTARVEHALLSRSIEAIDALEIDPARIGTVVSSSLYSLGCPTLAHRLIDHYEMAPTTDKYHVTGVGCASAVPLVKLGAQTLRDHPERQTLIVAAESMSGILMPAQEDDPRAKTVGSALFGDGCAAALLSLDPGAEGPVVLDSQVHQIPGTLGAVQLECEQDDSHLHLSRELPYLAGEELEQIVGGFLRRNRTRREQIDHWIVHPGGRRIIENVQSALSLSDEETELSWQALAEHGNVGTPSIFYVLGETIEQREPRSGDRALMVTIGPGVTVGLMLLSW